MGKDMHSRKITCYNLAIKNREFPMLHFKLLFLLNIVKGSPNQILKLLKIPTHVAYWEPWQCVPLWFVLLLSPNKAILLPLQICVTPIFTSLDLETRNLEMPNPDSNNQ